jgi:endonuclease G
MKVSRRVMAIGCALVVAAFLASPAVAETACPGHFAGGREPTLVNAKLTTQTIALCFQAYGALHSGLTRTPLWSAEHLTGDSLNGARQIQRRKALVHFEAP